MEPRGNPDANVSAVLMLYGAAMVAVQGLEHAVRWLYVVADTDPTKVSRASLERQWRHAMERLWRAFQTGTAAMKLNDAARGVKPRLDADVAAELERFLKGPRNRLVHGFLIERLRRTPDGEECFVQGTALELIEASRVAGTLTHGCTSGPTRFARHGRSSPSRRRKCVKPLS